MRIRLDGGLPYVTVSLTHNQKSLELDWVVLDTGSGSSVFSSDEMQHLGIEADPDDYIHQIAGVGGKEWVVAKRVDVVVLGDMALRGVEIHMGAMDYGFPIQGILGLDFLLQVRAVIDLDALEVRRA
jgi:predicted aspartyl protease